MNGSHAAPARSEGYRETYARWQADPDAYWLDMARARIKASFTYLPDKTHFDLYVRGDDKMALMKDNAWAMYAVARPGAKRSGK